MSEVSFFWNHDAFWSIGLVIAGLWMTLAPRLLRRLESVRGASLWTQWLTRMDPPAKLTVSTLIVGVLWLVQTLLMPPV